MSYYIYKFQDEATARKAAGETLNRWIANMDRGREKMFQQGALSEEEEQEIESLLEYLRKEDKPDCVIYETNLMICAHKESINTDWSDNLEKMGGTLIREGRESPVLSVVLKLPEGQQGRTLLQEINDFYILKGPVDRFDDIKVHCPWGSENQESPFTTTHTPENYMSPTDTFHHSDGETLMFSFIAQPDQVPRITNYLLEKGVSKYHISICDPLIERKSDLFLMGDVCPDCKQTKLRYLAAELESLPEDQYSCLSCGGMFTAAALEANAPYRKVAQNAIDSIESGVDSLFLVEARGDKENKYKILRMGADLDFETVGELDFYVRRFVAFTETLWAAFGMKEQEGRFAYTENGGKQWKFLDLPRYELIPSLARVPGTNTVFWAAKEGLLLSRNGARNWELVSAEYRNIQHMQALSDSVLFAMDAGNSYGEGDAVGNKFLSSTDGGRTWKKTKMKEVHSWAQLLMLDEEKGLFRTSQGKYYLTKNGGQRWDVSNNSHYHFDEFLPGENGVVYAIASRVGRGSLLRYSGGVRPLELLESRDGGQSWTLERSIKVWHFNCALLTKSGDLYLGDRRGVVSKQGPDAD